LKSWRKGISVADVRRLVPFFIILFSFLALNVFGNKFYGSDVDNDSTEDFWKLMDDGSLVFDGSADLYDEEGNLLLDFESDDMKETLALIMGLDPEQGFQMAFVERMLRDSKIDLDAEDLQNMGKVISGTPAMLETLAYSGVISFERVLELVHPENSDSRISMENWDGQVRGFFDKIHPLAVQEQGIEQEIHQMLADEMASHGYEFPIGARLTIRGDEGEWLMSDNPLTGLTEYEKVRSISAYAEHVFESRKNAISLAALSAAVFTGGTAEGLMLGSIAANSTGILASGTTMSTVLNVALSTGIASVIGGNTYRAIMSGTGYEVYSTEEIVMGSLNDFAIGFATGGIMGSVAHRMGRLNETIRYLAGLEPTDGVRHGTQNIDEVLTKLQSSSNSLAQVDPQSFRAMYDDFVREFGESGFSELRSLTKRVGTQLSDADVAKLRLMNKTEFGKALHMTRFDNGASLLVSSDAADMFWFGRNKIGYADNTMYVSTRADIDEALRVADGDYSVIEDLLGFPSGHFPRNKGIYRLDIFEPSNFDIRMPSGLEAGANPMYTPGGFTIGGIPEAVINQVPNNYNYLHIWQINRALMKRIK
jgi:hypothetical protein